MSQRVIELPPLGAPVDALWNVLLDLGAMPVRWTLIGGQMVLLHALAHGQVPPQISEDGDVVADIRADQASLRTVVRALTERGFDLLTITTDGRAHRYVRPAEPKPIVVDVLAPDGLGPRTNLVTTPPGRTVEVPGGTQALDRTEFVHVRHAGRTGKVPLPSLLGAIVLKAAACKLPGDSARHERDLALLIALVVDPFDMRAVMTTSDLRRLRAVRVLLESTHPAWRLVPSSIRAAGLASFEVLTTRG
jgi:hypothetical protein